MLRASLLALALAVGACRPGAAPTRELPPPADPCLIGAAAGASNDTVVIAMNGDITGAHAPRPRSEAERFAFAQVYETLVRVRCDGRVVPGLAARWRGDSTGARWTLTLREDARFSDGSPVTARDVAVAWRDRAPDSGLTRDVAAQVVEGITVNGDREITVHLRHPRRDDPAALAHPSLAIHRPTTHGWPIGSGTHLPPAASTSETQSAASATTITLRPRVPGRTPSLVVHTQSGADGRDLIDRGIDILIVRDRRVVDYAATGRELHAAPLAADRIHVLLTTHPPSSALVPRDSTAWRAFRESLAADAAPGELTAGHGTWWESPSAISSCATATAAVPPAMSSPPSARRPRRITYIDEDRVSGEIARRLVALVTFDRGTRTSPSPVRALLPMMFADTTRAIIAVPLSAAELSRSLARGDDFAYLVAFPRRSLAPCADWMSFAAQAPWLSAEHPIALAESGPVLLTSDRAPALTRDWDNTVRPIASTPAGGDPP